MKKHFIILSIYLGIIVLFWPSAMYGAGGAPTPSGDAASGNITRLENPIGATNVNVIIGRVIKGALGIVGALALFMFFWGGQTWLISAGNPEKVKAGTQTMIWAAVGVVIVFASYMILNGVFKTLEAIR